MAKKSATLPNARIEELCKEIKHEVAHWQDILEHGCQDPFSPDGCNMNLTRNHIIYYKRQLSDLCAEHGMVLPDEFYIKTPPEVPDKLFTGDVSSKRYQRLVGWDDDLITSTKGIPHYEPMAVGQISLF